MVNHYFVLSFFKNFKKNLKIDTIIEKKKFYEEKLRNMKKYKEL